LLVDFLISLSPPKSTLAKHSGSIVSFAFPLLLSSFVYVILMSIIPHRYPSTRCPMSQCTHCSFAVNRASFPTVYVMSSLVLPGTAAFRPTSSSPSLPCGLCPLLFPLSLCQTHRPSLCPMVSGVCPVSPGILPLLSCSSFPGPWLFPYPLSPLLYS